MKTPGFSGRNLWSFLVAIICLALVSGCQRPTQSIAVGDKAPDFSATDIDGNRIVLSELAGKPVVMRFFLPDCKYCRADTAVFNRFHESYRDQGLTIIYINTAQQPGAVRNFVNELGITFPVVLDVDGSLAAKYRVRAVPQAIVLSPDHTIMAALLGGVSEAELLELLGPYLNKIEDAVDSGGMPGKDKNAPVVAAGGGELADDTRCPVCGMFVAKYPDWVVRMQSGDSVLFFDGVKDMLVYLFTPEQFGGMPFASGSVPSISVKDYYSLELIDGRTAFYVTGSDVYGPMGHEFIAFATKAAAESFFADHKGKQILSFAEITPEQVAALRHGQTMK